LLDLSAALVLAPARQPDLIGLVGAVLEDGQYGMEAADEDRILHDRPDRPWHRWLTDVSLYILINI
jgi:hypothetical protein